MTDETLPQTSLKSGDYIHGFDVQRIVDLKENRAQLIQLEHRKTGAKHIHIASFDTENTFSVSFKTVPSDSTGVAHILEHTVLCGSKKFPVRDPFFSMIKRSLNSFMNAFTASDWTMYPYCTQNETDYYNLMDVYLDASFFPAIEELSFKQEGHRLELEKDKLVYKGVVYNEMKGAMSSPTQIMIRALMHALYPDTTYSNNSGGDPNVIPSLTHDQLVSFHRRHYHPSNAFFYTYGNLPLENHLAFIENKVLTHFTRIDPGTDVPPQPRWETPRDVLYKYPLEKNEEPTKKYQFCLAWLTTDIQNSFEILVLTVLEKILIGNSASPLRKALIDSGLGTALSDGTGYDADNRDTMFACGLKDVEKSAFAQIEKIIFDTLRNLSQSAIEPELIEAAIHQIEFDRKEITNMPYPYGLKLLLTICGTWFHGGDTVNSLKFDDDLKRLRERLTAGRFLEERIDHYFLSNPHFVRFTLEPDHTFAENEEKHATQRLKALKKALLPADIEKIKTDTTALQALQESEEDLSSLPTLEIDDIPPDVQAIQPLTDQADTTIIRYNPPTSGIFYVSLAAGVTDVTEPLVPYIPLFCSVFTRMGTNVHDYTEIARLVDAYTGGIGMSPSVRTGFDDAGNCIPFLSFGGKCLDRNQPKMFDIIEEFVTKYDFSNLSRLKTLLLEYKASLEATVVNSGHRYAISLASRNLSLSNALNETWSGIHQLQLIKKITQDLSEDALKDLSEKFAQIAATVLKQDNLQIALIGENDVLPEAATTITSIQNKLPLGTAVAGTDASFSPPSIAVPSSTPHEGWYTASAVSFVAKCFPTVRMGHPDAPALAIISKLLKSLYLHKEIREKGGAYGGFSVYNSETGLFCLASYRDPHILSTLNVFDTAMDFITSDNYDDEDVKEAILQLASEIDKPDTPSTIAKKAFHRKLISLTDDQRKHFKAQILSTGKKQVMAVAQNYFRRNDPAHAIAVISNADKLKAANDKLKDNPLTLYKI